METMEKTRLSRDIMAARLAREFQDGWIVNLGVGMPTLCSDFIPEGRFIVFHSENGVIGYGPNTTVEEATPYVVNAGVQPVLLMPYASIVHHSDAFGVIRRGLLNVGVLGAYEVSTNGDFANWKTAGRKGGGIGGAMDIAICAQQIFLIMEHTTRDGQPRLLEKCTLPITAAGVVTLVMTDLGLFKPMGNSFKLLEIAPGFTPEEIQNMTGAKVEVGPDLKEVSFV
jgi:3-oxoacid CoA-transferase B subunit